MHDSTWASIIGGIVGLTTGLWGYMKARSAIKLTERQMLAKEQNDYIKLLLTEIRNSRKEIKELRTDIEQLMMVNVELKAENIILTSKFHDLAAELKWFREEAGERK